MFQFQNGAIKIREKQCLCKYDNLFQFQNGAIKMNEKWRLDVFNSQFQFQNGAIKIRRNLNAKLIIWCVSIPEWCD